MIPSAFGYERPGTLEEALALLARHGEDARILSGGHSLLPVLKARLARPGVLIDIARIPGLSGIAKTAGGFRIGALTTHHEVESSPLVREACPLLAEAAGRIGDVQVRNRGTIGGSAAHADPAADYPAALLALEAALVASGPDGTRSIPAADFFTGPYESALTPSEILTAVEVPSPPRGSGGAYAKAAQQASGFAVCGVAALVTLGPAGGIASARVGVTGVAAPAYRARRTEDALAGKPASPESLRAAAALAAEGVDPLDDFYASADFRRQLAKVYAGRALAEALRPARGEAMDAVHPAIPWLRRENLRFHELLRGLSEADWRKPTLCTEWCAAQVVGHMIGGAASYADRVEAALEGRVIFGLGARSAEEFQAERARIMEETLAQSGPERVDRIAEADRRLDEALARLTPGGLDRPTRHRKGDLLLRLFPGQRLGEVVLHRRDLGNDPAAPLETGAIGVLARVLEERIPRQFESAPDRGLAGLFRIETEAPDHAFTLEAREGALLPAPGAGSWDVRLRTPAGGTILLATGRAGQSERERAGRLRIEGDRQKAEALMRAVFRPI